MNILAVSDVELGFIYSAQLGKRFQHIDIAFGCGDLPYYYLEYIISSLDIPLYYVRGNHSSKIEIGDHGDRTDPWGAIDLHRQVKRDPETNLLLAGIEGSLRYNYGSHQYSQVEMWNMVFGLAPALYLNRVRYGRYLDIFICHAPPWKIHDKEDLPHRGIKAFNWLIKVFQPAYCLHGHIHVYRSDTVTETVVGATHVVNVYGYRDLKLDLKASERPVRAPHKEKEA